MGTLNTKGRCPKCGGSLYLEKDYNGWYEECLQCGYMKDLVIIYQDNKKTVKTVKEKVPEKIGGGTDKKNVAPGK